jgi:hypothetical protein
MLRGQNYALMKARPALALAVARTPALAACVLHQFGRLKRTTNCQHLARGGYNLGHEAGCDQRYARRRVSPDPRATLAQSLTEAAGWLLESAET